jgi:hypothetical protein
VQVAFGKVHDLFAPRVFDPGVADVPLAGYRPVERGGAGGHFVDRERQEFAQDAQGFAHPVARNAPADRKQPLNEAVHFPAGLEGFGGRRW